MAVRSAVGFRASAVASTAALFDESPSRAVVCVAPEQVDEVGRRAAARAVDVTDLGSAGGDQLTVDGLIQLPLTRAGEAWRSKLPAALGTGATQG